jgi:Protein of unknown function (DUF1778)
MKTAQLQIRVSPAQKKAIESAARRAGLGMSSYVLTKVLLDDGARWRELLNDVLGGTEVRLALAELSGWLARLDPASFESALAEPPPAGLTDYQANSVAAMVEHLCVAQRVAPPAWTRLVRPLERPVFASQLPSLRLHLLTQSPPAYRRRNLFVDTAVGGQV